MGKKDENKILNGASLPLRSCLRGKEPGFGPFRFAAGRIARREAESPGPKDARGSRVIEKAEVPGVDNRIDSNMGSQLVYDSELAMGVTDEQESHLMILGSLKIAVYLSSSLFLTFSCLLMNDFPASAPSPAGKANLALFFELRENLLDKLSAG